MRSGAAPRGAPRGSLALRLGTRLLAGSALVLLLAGVLTLRLERAHLTALVSASAERIAETIRSSAREDMLRNDAEGLRRTMANIAAQPGIVRIRVFNKEGRIRSSTAPGEVGALVDTRAEQCQGCHGPGRPLVALPRRDRVRLFEDQGGRHVLGVIAPIHNEPQCAAGCHVHPPQQRVLGVLDVQLSLDGVDQALRASQRQLALGLLLTAGGVALLAGGLVWRMVLRPLRELRGAIAAVEGGDLRAQVRLRSPDELGELAQGWNRMTGELLRARAELEEWNRGLEARVAEKTAELQRTHERLRLAEKLASLGQLAAVVAHELNNPLAGIRTFARLLLRRAESGAWGAPGGGADDTRHVLEMVEGEAARCGDVVRDLLLFARASDARFAPAAPGPLLRRVAALLRHKAELGGVALECELPAALPQVECDAGQVEQVLLALALNALEATPAGGVVRLCARPAPRDPELGGRDGVRLEVVDTGSGIPEELRARVFEPFVTTKEAGRGVGLGLAVAYGIVERHRGLIAFEPSPGGGTAFRVLLPCRRAQDGAAQEAA